MKKLEYGKYRGIIISIALFLVLDTSVLVLNFYMSYQIADDAIGVNIAGRQRMLSQRITKSLFDIQASLDIESELQRSTSELRAASTLFNSSFNAFDIGGLTPAPDGEPAILTAVSSEGSLNAMAAAKPIWTSYLSSIEKLLSINPLKFEALFSSQLEETLQIGRTENLKLLTEMNNLTVDLEGVARSKAETLRLIQTVGISLAILNFIIIMFHSVKQLRSSDRKIEAAQNETQEILDTVNEGLFLLDKDGVIGDQYSAELEKIMARESLSGMKLNQLLGKIVSERDLITTQKYIGLLFDPTKREKLLGSLNPLRSVEAHMMNDQGVYESKFLRFSFSRVLLDKEIRHILVTVSDITKQISLSQELEAAKKQSEQQFEMLTALISNQADMMPLYLKNSRATLSKINDYLRTPAKSHSQFIDKTNNIYKQIHSFKGESAALEMDQFMTMAHQFEDELSSLRNKPNLEGNDFLHLTVMLDNLTSQVETAQKIIKKVENLSTVLMSAKDTSESDRSNWSHLQTLSQQVSKRQKKQVELLYSGLNDYSLPENIQSMLNNVSVQLIRNSITHGIESPDERFESQKSKTGLINIRLVKKQDSSFEYHFEDDGKGLDMDGIRRSAIQKGLITEQESEQMDRKQIISLIFKPDISTSSEVDEDSGRGVGMASVEQSIRGVGGRISIASRRGIGCSFVIKFPFSVSASHSDKKAA